jgi:DNA-binding NarL/FixJ family response regulator
MQKLTIVLADDHHVVRQGLRTLLEGALDCTVVGEAADGWMAVDLVKRLQPAVLVVDMVLPKLHGLEVIRHVRQAAPETRIVVLSMHADESYVREALRAGATGYILKESHADEFVQAVQHAATGRRYLSAPLNDRALDAYIAQAADSSFDLLETLTSRERDVLLMAARGSTTVEIAEQFSLSTRTVEAYRARMMHKLGLHSQMDLIRYALRRGLIAIED